MVEVREQYHIRGLMGRISFVSRPPLKRSTQFEVLINIPLRQSLKLLEQIDAIYISCYIRKFSTCAGLKTDWENREDMRDLLAHEQKNEVDYFIIVLTFYARGANADIGRPSSALPYSKVKLHSCRRYEWSKAVYSVLAADAALVTACK